MKLVTNQEGRIVHLFPIDELRPTSGMHLADVIDKIVEGFHFTIHPGADQPLRQLSLDKLVFRDGRLLIGNRQINIVELSIYSDGLVVGSATTDDAELVIENFLKWGEKTLGLRPLINQPSQRFLSTVVVDFDKKMDGIIGNLNAISKLATPLLEDTYKISLDLHLSTFAIGVDDLKMPKNFEIGKFHLERRLGIPFDSERFISQAPLPNDAHIRWLESLEKLAS